MDLRVPDDGEDLREQLPDFNDERYPQDSPAGTFRGTKVLLKQLMFSDDIDWEHFI